MKLHHAQNHDSTTSVLMEVQAVITVGSLATSFVVVCTASVSMIARHRVKVAILIRGTGRGVDSASPPVAVLLSHLSKYCVFGNGSFLYNVGDAEHLSKATYAGRSDERFPLPW